MRLYYHVLMAFILCILLATVTRAEVNLIVDVNKKVDAVSVVVNHLRMRLQQSEEYRRWDAEYIDWWTVWDVRTERGEYEPLF